MGRGEPVVFYTEVCERYLTLLFRGRECVLMRGHGDAATISGALAGGGPVGFLCIG